MARLLLLLLLAVPAYAEDVEPIVVSPGERQAIIDKFTAMQSYIEKLEKGLKVCLQVQRS